MPCSLRRYPKAASGTGLPVFLRPSLVRRQTTFVVTLALLIGLLAGSRSSIARAEVEEPPPFSQFDLLVDDETLLVVELDVDQIEPSAIVQWLRDQEIIPSPPPPMLVAMADGMVAPLRAAGAKHVFIVVSSRNVFRDVVFAIPCREPDKVSDVLQLLATQVPDELGWGIHSLPGLIVLGTDQSWQRLQERLAENPLDEANIASRFPKLGQSEPLPHRVTISLPARLRRELAGLWPDELPAEMVHALSGWSEGDGMEDEPAALPISPRQLVADTRSFSLAWQLPPQPAVEVRFESDEIEASRRVAESLRATLAMFPEVAERVEVEHRDRAVIAGLDSDALEELIGRIAQPLQAAAAESEATNSLWQIGIAMHNYHDVHGHLPPRATVTPEGEPLLSWRVHILPHIAQESRYNAFRLDEPWDSPHNVELVESMPEIFSIAGDQLAPGHTRFRLPQIEESLWHSDGPPRSLRDVRDGTSNTIAAAVAPADQSVPWTKPEPWELDPERLIESFFGDADEVTILLLDGSVLQLDRTIGAETLRALLTHAGGEAVEVPRR